jgi:hypothetical protein
MAALHPTARASLRSLAVAVAAVLALGLVALGVRIGTTGFGSGRDRSPADATVQPAAAVIDRSPAPVVAALEVPVDVTPVATPVDVASSPAGATVTAASPAPAAPTGGTTDAPAPEPAPVTPISPLPDAPVATPAVPSVPAPAPAPAPTSPVPDLTDPVQQLLNPLGL